MTAFALLSLLLSVAGVFGLTSLQVSQRTAELAVRAALGAGPASLRWLVLRRSVTVLAMGILIGGLVFFFLSRLLVTLLFGLARFDFRTAAAAGVLIAVAVLAASFVPTYKVGRLDSATVLRRD